MTTKPPLKPKPAAIATTKIITAEGWGKPAGSSLRHYIRGQRSLCRQWGFYGNVSSDTSAAPQCERCRELLAHGTLPAVAPR